MLKVKTDSVIKLTVIIIPTMLTPFVVLFSLMMLTFIKRQKELIFFITKIIPFLLVISILAIISIAKDNEMISILHHARDFIIFLFTAFYLLAISQYQENSTKIVYTGLKNIFVIFAIIKILLLLFVTISGLSMFYVFSFILDNFGLEMMTTDTSITGLFRIQFPIDAILPFILFYLLKEISKSQKTLLLYVQLFILIFSLLLTMSRASWFVGVLMLALSYYFNFNFSKKLKTFLLLSIFFIFAMTFTNVIYYITAIIDTRFGALANSANYYSDLERTIQINYMWNAFVESPFFGNGLGYYLPNLIRSDDKYIYEVQTLSFLMDFGIIFNLIFIALIIYNLLEQNKKSLKNCMFGFLFLCIWLFVGSTNPLLLNVIGGVMVYFAFNADNLDKMNFSLKS